MTTEMNFLFEIKVLYCIGCHNKVSRGVLVLVALNFLFSTTMVKLVALLVVLFVGACVASKIKVHENIHNFYATHEASEEISTLLLLKVCTKCVGCADMI